MRKKRLLQIYCYDYAIHPGGLEKIAQTLRQELNQMPDMTVTDMTSDLVTSGALHNKKEDVVYLPSVEIISGYPIPKIRSAAFRRIIQALAKNKPDIIQTHTRFFIYTLLGGILAKLWGVKRIHLEHGSGFVTGYPQYIKFVARLFDWTVGLWVFRQADTIITISQAHKKFIQKFTNKTPIVIYNPISYIPKPKAKNYVPHIGFIGRLASLKGVDVLISALKKLENKQWKCTIVGQGDQEENLHLLVERLGLSDRINFVGADDRNNWLHTFDIFVNPSYQEGLPTTVVEALLAKCIVVATNVGGTREISQQDDLLLVPAGDSIGLAKSIHKTLSVKIKKGLSYDHVKEKFGTDKIISEYANIYKTIFGK